MKHIVLTGFMGVGKTTLGKQLAAHYNRPFYDIDDEICLGEHQTIHELITDSQAYFRALECEYVQAAIKQEIPSIISLGGGAYCHPKTYNIIKDAQVVSLYLSMSDDTCLQQLEHIKKSRPLLNAMGGDQWKKQALELYQKRRPLYERADIQIAREGLTLKGCIQRIEEYYGKIY